MAFYDPDLDFLPLLKINARRCRNGKASQSDVCPIGKYRTRPAAIASAMSCSSTASLGAELHFCCSMHYLVVVENAMPFLWLSVFALRATACRFRAPAGRDCVPIGTRLCGLSSACLLRRGTRRH